MCNTICPLSSRRLVYADGKPRPRCRGIFHALFTIFAIIGAILFLYLSSTATTTTTVTKSKYQFQLASYLLFKAITTGASAVFHCWPFTSSNAVTNAFIVDLLCVPFSPIGLYTLIEGKNQGEYDYDEIIVMVHLICFTMNGFAVLYQMKGHIGLDTPKGRSDAYRIVPVTISTVFSIITFCVRIPYDMHNVLFLIGGLLFGCIGSILVGPVTIAHMKNLSKPNVFPWHLHQWWGMHEDMHLFMILSDVCFLMIGLKQVVG
jgi:hypothetical protein